MATRDTAFDLKSIGKTDNIGIFEGYAAYFNNIDRVDDIIAPNAFDDVDAKSVVLLWGHDQNSIIGGVKELKSDEKGLFGKFELNLNVKAGLEAYELLKAGHLKTMSIGYRVKEREWVNDTNIRLIKKAELYEVSLVAIPANPKAEVTDIKSLPNERDLERTIRDEWGLTNTQAKAFISKHYKPFMSDIGKRDVVEQELNHDELKQIISSSLQFKKPL